VGTNSIDRRALLRTLLVTVGAAAIGRALAACSDSHDVPPFENLLPTSPPPSDQDEHVPGTTSPINVNNDVPKVPNQVWEARAKQLEAEQRRLFGRAAFKRGDAGVMGGKENSHEPKVSVVTTEGKSRVEVRVEHVMGNNGLDAGALFDAGKDAASGRIDAGAKVDAGSAPIHFITSIFLRGMVDGVDTVVALWEFNSTDAAPATVQFTMPIGVTSVVAYEWCTLHGLWSAPALVL
jgi:desulfoferrodoxin (superoxide reductase-like protein)